MTSRSGIQAALRQDNAYDEPPPSAGRSVCFRRRYKAYLERAELVEKERKRFETTTIKPSPDRTALVSLGNR